MDKVFPRYNLIKKVYIIRPGMEAKLYRLLL